MVLILIFSLVMPDNADTSTMLTKSILTFQMFEETDGKLLLLEIRFINRMPKMCAIPQLVHNWLELL